MFDKLNQFDTRRNASSQNQRNDAIIKLMKERLENNPQFSFDKASISKDAKSFVQTMTNQME